MTGEPRWVPTPGRHRAAHGTPDRHDAPMGAAQLRRAAALAREIAADVRALADHPLVPGYGNDPEWSSICHTRAALYERKASGYDARANDLEAPCQTP